MQNFEDLQSMLFLGGASIGIIVFCFALVIGVYLLFGFALRKVLIAFNHQSPNMAFIPFYNNYLLGELCTQSTGTYGGGIIALPNWFLRFGWLIGSACSFIPTVGAIATLVVNLFWGASVYNFLYSRLQGKTEEDTKVLAIISCFVGIIPLIIFLGLPKQGVQVRKGFYDVYPKNAMPACHYTSESKVSGQGNTQSQSMQGQYGQQMQMQGQYGQPMQGQYGQQQPMQNQFGQQQPMQGQFGQQQPMQGQFGQPQPMQGQLGQPMQGQFNQSQQMGQQTPWGNQDGFNQPMQNTPNQQTQMNQQTPWDNQNGFNQPAQDVAPTSANPWDNQQQPQAQEQPQAILGGQGGFNHPMQDTPSANANPWDNQQQAQADWNNPSQENTEASQQSDWGSQYQQQAPADWNNPANQQGQQQQFDWNSNQQ